MKLAIINPNSTESMTEKCRLVAQEFKNSDTEIWASNPKNSPKSIEGHYDEVQSLMGLMEEIKKAQEWGADAYVIACFDDPGRSVPIIEDLAHKYGMNRFCKKVRAADIPVLALEDGTCDAMGKIEEAILKAVKDDNCEAIILGCAGMADLTMKLSKSCKIPVVDGVLCAVKMAESLVGAGLLTSKINSYSYPILK